MRGGLAWERLARENRTIRQNLVAARAENAKMAAVVEVARKFVPRVRMDTGKPYSTHNLNTDCISHNGECSHCDFCGMPWPCEIEQLRIAFAALEVIP